MQRRRGSSALRLRDAQARSSAPADGWGSVAVSAACIALLMTFPIAAAILTVERVLGLPVGAQEHWRLLHLFWIVAVLAVVRRSLAAFLRIAGLRGPAVLVAWFVQTLVLAGMLTVIVDGPRVAALAAVIAQLLVIPMAWLARRMARPEVPRIGAVVAVSAE